ncbi:MAG: hypothetical protein QXV17_06980 [Candidatus Micrarchaeaceae archaeon]
MKDIYGHEKPKPVGAEGASDYTLQKQYEPERTKDTDAILRTHKAPKKLLGNGSEEETELEPFMTLEGLKNMEDKVLMKQIFGDFENYDESIDPNDDDYDNWIAHTLELKDFDSILGESKEESKKRRIIKHRHELEEKKHSRFDSKRHIHPKLLHEDTDELTVTVNDEDFDEDELHEDHVKRPHARLRDEEDLEERKHRVPKDIQAEKSLYRHVKPHKHHDEELTEDEENGLEDFDDVYNDVKVT